MTTTPPFQFAAWPADAAAPAYRPADDAPLSGRGHFECPTCGTSSEEFPADALAQVTHQCPGEWTITTSEAVCNHCGRITTAPGADGTRDTMVQPDGRLCGGMFVDVTR